VTNNKLHTGDHVRLIDEDGQGVVQAVRSQEVDVMMDGMLLTYLQHELVKVEHDELVQKASPDIRPKDQTLQRQNQQKLKDIGRPTHEVYELDLHIHELLDHYQNMTNTEILRVQMSACKSFVNEAIGKRYQKIVLIHGVGEGVLKAEIIKWLDSQSHIEYHDAPYRTYGYGATEVIIHR